MGELPLQPRGERRVLDLQLGRQRACRRARAARRGPGCLRNPVVDDPAAAGDGRRSSRTPRVVPVGNEDGQREAVQQPLGRALPVGLLLADRDQLAGERQRLLGQPQLAAEPGPQVQIARGDVALARPQAAQLGVHLGGLVVELAAWRRPRSVRLFWLAAMASWAAPGRRRSAGGGRRSARRSHRVQAALREQLAELLRGACGRPPGSFSRRCRSHLGEAVAAVAGAFDVQAGLPLPQVVQPFSSVVRWAVSRVRSVSRLESSPSRRRAL